MSERGSAAPGLGTLARELQADRCEIKQQLLQTVPAAGAVDRVRLTWLRHADRAELWRSEGARDMAEFVAALFQVSNWKARRWLDAARQLESLPHLAASLENGALSLDKTVELTRFATPQTEQRLLRWARRVTVAAVRTRADAETKRPVEDVADAHRQRYLRTTTYEHHVQIDALLPADQGIALTRAVDDLAHRLPCDPEARVPDSSLSVDQGSIEQRRADALVLLATAGGDASVVSTEIVLHAPVDALASDDHGCTVAGGPVLHPETARKLACDARLRVVLEGKDGNALGIGDASQITPWWLRQQVFHRDGYTCTFPGCEMKRFLHPHHIWHWIRGGPTDLDNLLTVCTFHHDLLHEGRWSVALRDGRPVWFRPGGREHDPGPAPPEQAPIGSDEPLRLSAAAGYSRLFDIGLLMQPGTRIAGNSHPALRARLRERRLPDWARMELARA